VIVETQILSPRGTVRVRVRYYPQGLDSQVSKVILKRAREMPSLAVDGRVSHLALVEWVLPNGVRLKCAVARGSGAYTLVAADELERDSSVLEKVASIAAGLHGVTNGKPLTRLSRHEKRNVVVFVNEQCLDYVRFVLFGVERTGKSSIFSLASRGMLRPEYVPTRRPVVAPHSARFSDLLEIDDLSSTDQWFLVANRVLTLYDLPGSHEYWRLWPSYLKRADVGVLVLRSTRRGIARAQVVLRRFRSQLPSLLVAIANYQDAAEAVPPTLIERVLGLRTYGMVATDLDRVEQIRDMLKTVAITMFQSNSVGGSSLI